MSRKWLILAGLTLAGAALWRSGGLQAGQGAVSWSLAPAHEDLTFWVNHDGLTEINVEGEVGFGDMARILMRRRANRDGMKALRDRFVFKTREFDKLTATDLTATTWIAAAGRAVNVPYIKSGKGYFAKFVFAEPGIVKRTVEGREITFDVRPLAKLRARITDEQGRPASARIYLTAADGLGYAPKGTVSRFTAESAEQFFHATDSFELDLPAGDTTIEATRGPEYELTAVRRRLEAGRTNEVTIRLKRWVNMASRHWYSSDAHIHANYTAAHHQVVTKDDVLAYTLGEDLHLPNMMVANSFGAFLHDTAYFTGKLDAISRPPYLIWWNEEMRNGGVYGHMCLYGLNKLVEPLYTGFRGTPQDDDYPPNYTQAKATQDQGGAVTYAHPGYAPNIDGASARELPVDLALGAVDAMDVLSNNPEEVAMELWYRLLNTGLRLGISAGTDAFTNVADHYTPGGGRVYAHLAGPVRYEDWIKAYKRGRTMATNGPMLFLRVNQSEPGDELTLERPGTVKIDLKVETRIPVDKIELIVNGKAVSPVPKTLQLDKSAWIAARATGPWHRLVLNDAYTFAHTSPVYVKVAGRPISSPEDAGYWMDWIDRLIERTNQRARFSTPARKEEVLALFRKAREVYAGMR